MSDKYTEAAFDATLTSINEHVGQLISEEDLVDILESLDELGFKVVANTPPIQIPFVIRPTKAIDDLERYSVRREEVHGGASYYAYYQQPDLGTAERVKAEFDKELGRTDKTKIVVVNRGLRAPSDATLSKLSLPDTSDWVVPYPPSHHPLPEPNFMMDGKFNEEIYRMMIEEEINFPLYPNKVKLLKPDPVADLEDLKVKTEGLDPNDPMSTQEQQRWIVILPRFVDYVENPEELAARIRESVADLNVDWTYPKTVIVPESDVGSSESNTKGYVDLLISMDFSRKEPTEIGGTPAAQRFGPFPDGEKAKQDVLEAGTLPSLDIFEHLVSEFRIELTEKDQSYTAMVRVDQTTFVPQTAHLELLSAIKSVIEGVESEGKDKVETRRLILTNIDELFKGNDKYLGTSFTNLLEA